MPSAKHKVLKMTTTRTFKIDHPDRLESECGPYGISANRAVLDKMLPQFSERKLSCWICPYVSSNFNKNGF
jgi:hypothetical protein